MKVALALTVFVAFSAGSAVAARFGAREEWELWHANAQLRLQQTASAGRAGDAPERRMMSESLALHLRARELLHDTDLPTSMLRKFHEGLDAHAGLMDQALALSPQEQANAADMLRLLKKSEASTVREYYAALHSGVLPPPRPKVGSLKAALLKATGIDATQDDDGRLFNIMVEHYGGTPPAAALGVSAKFFADGRQLTGRYHVGLRLPCASATIDAAQLSSSSHKAASALSAPSIVHAWIEAVGDASVGLGFGFAKLDNAGKKGGKVYVMNRAGTVMPPLPLSLGVKSKPITVYDSVPLLKPQAGSVQHPHWLDSQMVSLEWQIGDDRVVLRHYYAERGVAHEHRIRSSGSQAEAGLIALVTTANAKTETVAYTAPFHVVVGAVSEPPAIVGSKVGMQLPDSTMPDDIFLSVAESALSGVDVPKTAVEKWLGASRGVPHTVSNLQAAATAGGSYITLYRHPLNVCFESFTLSEDELKARQLRRSYSISECDAAKLRLAESMWGTSEVTNAGLSSFYFWNKVTNGISIGDEGIGKPPEYMPTSMPGTCADSHEPTGRCRECMEQWSGQNGAYIVKNKTACGAGVKTKDLVLSGRWANIKGCVEAVRNFQADRLKLEVFGFQAEYFLAGSVSGSFKCQVVYIEPSLVPPPTNFKEYPGFDKCVTNACRDNPSLPPAERDDSQCCALPNTGSCAEGYIYCKGLPMCSFKNEPQRTPEAKLARWRDGFYDDVRYDKVSTCCMPNTSNFAGCPAQPAVPANPWYQSQAKVLTSCTTESPDLDLWRSPGTINTAGTNMGKMGLLQEHFPDYCAKVCKDQWLTPCSAICKDDLKAVFDKCSSCKGGKNFCVNSAENCRNQWNMPCSAEEDKKAYEWAKKLPMAPKICSDFGGTTTSAGGGTTTMAPTSSGAPNNKDCVAYVVPYIEAKNNVPNDIAVFLEKVTDGDIMDVMTTWAPRQCRPPLHEWWGKEKFVCNECHSVIREAEILQQQQLWSGGGGFCDYANECRCPPGDHCDATKIQECQSAPTPCQCTCRDALARAASVCGANVQNASGHTVALDPYTCDTALTSACTVKECMKEGRLTKWSDRKDEFRPRCFQGASGDSPIPFPPIDRLEKCSGPMLHDFSPRSGYHWHFSQCLAEKGEYKTTCSNSLATMDDAGKADYVKRMISGCRLGADRSCVDPKYQYDQPLKACGNSDRDKSISIAYRESCCEAMCSSPDGKGGSDCWVVEAIGEQATCRDNYKPRKGTTKSSYDNKTFQEYHCCLSLSSSPRTSYIFLASSLTVTTMSVLSFRG